MKKILILTAVMLLIALGMAGCTDEFDKGVFGGEPIFVQPMYTGETITTLDKEFTKDDFVVYVNYEDNSIKNVEDYEITSTSLKNGMYIVQIKWRDFEGEAYIFIDDSLVLGTETSAPETVEETTEATTAE